MNILIHNIHIFIHINVYIFYTVLFLINGCIFNK